jgi:DNA-binding transcriptional ArsR family regulator
MNLVFKALSDPTRRRILQLLRGRPVAAGQIAEHFDIAKSTLSAHFAVLFERLAFVRSRGVRQPKANPPVS